MTSNMTSRGARSPDVWSPFTYRSILINFLPFGNVIKGLSFNFSSRHRSISPSFEISSWSWHNSFASWDKNYKNRIWTGALLLTKKVSWKNSQLVKKWLGKNLFTNWFWQWLGKWLGKKSWKKVSCNKKMKLVKILSW